MQAIVARKDIYEGVQTVGRAVSGRSTLPILSHLLVQPQGNNTLKLTATDLEMWMECTLPARLDVGLDALEDSSTGFTAPARVFTELLSALPDADVRLDRADGGNKIQISCARSEYNIMGLASEEFPSPPEVTPTATLTMPGGLLRDMIRHVLFAVSTDETRPVLTGVLLFVDGEVVKMVATDTHRLAVRTATIKGNTGSANAIIPARAMNELLRLAGEDDAVIVSPAQGQCRFEVYKGTEDSNTEGITLEQIAGKYLANPVTLVTRLLEGQFPNYERVVPKEFNRKLTLETNEFSRAVKRAAIVARDSANRVVIETEGSQLIIKAESGTVGNVREEIEVAREGDDIQIAFNAKYMGDALGVIDTEGVVLKLSEPLRPGVLCSSEDAEGAEYLCVLMPMQVI